MEREDFLNFIRHYSLSEILCGYSTPLVTEFEYARVYSSELKQCIKVKGNTFMIMFDSTNYFSISVPDNSLPELKYSFRKIKLDYNDFKIKFNENQIQIVQNEHLKIKGNYKAISDSMIYLKLDANR